MSQELMLELPTAVDTGRALTGQEMTAQSMVIHRILNEVMVEGIHYGKVPGADKPTLLQPGAEKICATFRLAPKYHVEDLSEPHNNFYRYRVACSLYTIRDGLFVGSAVGEASSAEEKYSWERAVCEEHYETTDPTRRRLKFKKAGGENFEKIHQVQRNAADLANTVLKMATKRAFISATRAATAASDLLDVDLDEPAVADLAKDERAEQPKPKAKPKPAPSFSYGKHKGQPITDPAIEIGYLQFMADSTAAAVADPAKAKFVAQNRLFLLALDAEIASRNAKATPGTSPEPNPGLPPTPTAPDAPALSWGQLIYIWEGEYLDEYQEAKKAFSVASAHDITAPEQQAEFRETMRTLVDTK